MTSADDQGMEMSAPRVSVGSAEPDLVRRTEDGSGRCNWRAVFEHGPGALLVVDAGGDVLAANRAARRLLASAAPLVGRSLPALLHGERDRRTFQLHQNAALEADGGAADTALALEYELDLGQLVCQRIAVRASAIEREPPQVLLALEPVARGEIRRRNKRGRLSTIVDSAIDGILTVGPSGAIESANPAVERIFGHAVEVLSGQPLARLIPSVRQLRAVRKGEDVEPAAGPWTQRQAAGVRADGSSFPLELTIGDFDGEHGCFVVLVRDISERKRLEQQLARSQRMEAIGRLASGVAHDFNNLLMGISGCCDIALGHVAQDSPVEFYVREIRNAAIGGGSITRQLLDFGRADDDVERSVVLDDAIAALDTMLRRLIGEDIVVDVSLDASGAVVPVSDMQVEQMLLNLAANARDAMPEGGRLEIRTEIGTRGPGGALPAGIYAVLEVSDTGHGMDARTLEHAFDPFFTTKSTGAGSGLGLSTIYGIVRRAGGVIDVSSELNGGSTFTIELPCQQPRETVALPERGLRAKPQGAGRNVLVVEDDPLVRMAVRYYLEAEGFRVLVASSGPEAVECGQRFTDPIDLLVTDIILPGLGGRDVAREIVAARQDTRVLYMSAHATEDLVLADRLPASAAALRKPFTRDALIDKVRALLDS